MSYSRFKTSWRTRIALSVVFFGLLAGEFSYAARKPVRAVAPAKANPETMLAEIHKDLAQHNLRAAQQKADALVEAYPTFRLGHLIRGDILLMHTRPVAALGAAAMVPTAPVGTDAKLADLRREATVRMQAEPGRPSPTLLPRALLQLRKDQRHALIVDAKHSRLYLYENRNDQIRLLQDFYVSQGKLGINKLKEGDMRTPVGVYNIVGRLPGVKLPDLYGKGALPLDYPNDWDKVQGRGGSGIWVHGVPNETFSRPPLSTDGCVVVSNDDLNLLTRIVEVGKTPVLIGDQVEFVSKEQLERDLRVASSLVENWRRDVENRDETALRSLYSVRFKSSNDGDLNTWLDKNRYLPGVKNISVTVTDSAFFRQPSQEEMIVSSFTQQIVAGKFRHAVRKKQYWAREGKNWKIVAESNLS
ncbi:L,D-transpeptidase family protein [Duganella qianjiadongensis]|uniref:L,D-transpeptidase family protein n=1 Tax=Duganella qianjiadongensis TaxID=2692176 RepID=A0ABW9VLS1_9BURK|nr:L,D-transpeptidase family protein [Duganella qianjiadongensis]MYM40391.1 L,D-transpeptidase family protein [Duganella qianjiadongensis]